MTLELLIAGGGIGGLAAAVAARRAGWEVRLFEQAPEIVELGAGIQMGPNVTRILHEWDLLGALAPQAVAPPRLRVGDAVDGRALASIELGESLARCYGAPYLTVHRADLQAALLQAARSAGTRLHTGCRVEAVQPQAGCVALRTTRAAQVEGDALVVADGLWSGLRAAVCADDRPPQATGHLAYRGLVRQQELPAALRSDEVSVWLAPHLHLVTYPVRGGDWLNAVCVVHGTHPGDPRCWDHAASRAQLEAALGPVCSAVRERIDAMPQWRLWMLHDRAPVASADALVRGRVALLGDAGHPMRPYLAQGAGMAIEDARELQRVLAVTDERVVDVPTALRRYALNRWQRVARVQQRSRRNGTIFHAGGALRLARNVALRLQGARLLDQPWLYGG